MSAEQGRLNALDRRRWEWIVRSVKTRYLYGPASC